MSEQDNALGGDPPQMPGDNNNALVCDSPQMSGDNDNDDNDNDEKEEDISCQGQRLDEYMKNATVDPTLIVSKPDRKCLMVSRGKSAAQSTNIYRIGEDKQQPVSANNNQPDDSDVKSMDLRAASIIVSASDSRRGRMSVASNYSNISFSSVISDIEEEEEEEEEAAAAAANKGQEEERTNASNSNDVRGGLPSSGLVSNEWRKTLEIAPIAASNTITRLERQLTEFIHKELRKLKQQQQQQQIPQQTNKKKKRGMDATDTGTSTPSTPSATSTTSTTPNPLLSSFNAGASSSKSSTNNPTNTSKPPVVPIVAAKERSTGANDEHVDERLHIYNQALTQLIASHEMKSYRSVLTEYSKLSTIKLNRIDNYKIKIDELSSLLGAVEKKAQKRIVAIYKHCSLENDRLKQELHQCKMMKERDEKIHRHRENISRKEVEDLKTSMATMKTQRERMVHVHTVLLKYFNKHALWKSDDEDPNLFANMGRHNQGAHESPEDRHQEELILTSLSSLSVSSLTSSTALGNKLKGRLGKVVEMDEEDKRLERSIAAADQINAETAAHEHELAEWKQIHLSMSAMTESHMAALGGLEDCTNRHSKQLNELNQKIEQLEKDKTNLLIEQGPGPTPIPSNVILLKSPTKEFKGEMYGIHAGSTNLSKIKNATTTAAVDNNGVEAEGKKRTGTTSKASLPPPPKLEKKRTNFDGLAPIVVEILKRRPLPALDKDAVIIKVKQINQFNTKSKAKRMPKPPQQQKYTRHVRLHSNNPNASFHRKITHNPHNASPRKVSRLRKPYDVKTY